MWYNKFIRVTGGVKLDIEKRYDLIKYEKTDDLIFDIKEIINSAQVNAYRAINAALVQRNWLIGYRIAEEELNGKNALNMERN